MPHSATSLKVGKNSKSYIVKMSHEKNRSKPKVRSPKGSSSSKTRSGETAHKSGPMGNGAMKTPYTSHNTLDKISASATLPYNNPSQDLHAGDSGMERVKKMLSSPLTRRKGTAAGAGSAAPATVPDNASPGHKYFGVHLEDVVNREGGKVPRLITKVCGYIHENGLNQEGVFRVNGNSRVVEKLKASFDRTGDADFEETGDVMSVAGLLKLFLRELPEAVVPEITTKQFVAVQEDLVREPELCLQQLGDLLRRLPRVHHETLKYLVHFLVLVTRQEDVNKMSAMALGIVFGPNVFRVAGGILGLKEQGVTNHIMSKFISEYDRLFLGGGDKSPYSSDTLQDIEGKKVPPPRPPPPKQAAPPVPSPRKAKAKRNGMPLYLLEGDLEHDTPHSVRSDGTPRFSDDEYLDTYRSQSPIALDSERSERCETTHSPLNTLTTEALNKVITSAVTEHLFGDGSTHSSDDSHASSKHDASCPVPAPRRKRRDRAEESSDTDRSASDDNKTINVRDRVRHLDSTESPEPVPMRPAGDRHGRRRPNSQAFEHFETQGIIITPASKDGPRPLPDRKRPVNVEVESEDEDTLQEEEPRPVPKPRHHGAEIRLHQMNGQDVPESDDSGFGTIHRSSDTLVAFKRAPGPKNRRNPTRQTLKHPTSSEEAENEEPLPLHALLDDQNDSPSRPSKPRQAFVHEVHSAPSRGKREKHLPSSDEEEEEEDMNHNATKPCTDFLKLHHHNGVTDENTSPHHSPNLYRKQYSVPPLDLSILHEHGDGSDPILAAQGLSLHKCSIPKVNESAMLSPRTAKMRKKHSNLHVECSLSQSATAADPEPLLSPSALRIPHNQSAHTDTDIPPSPPTQQTHFEKRDDEYGSQIKQLTKRIQSCKRKLKSFEENFEQEKGYRPSQQDKSQRPEMKKVMQELARARKELRTSEMQYSSPSAWSHLGTSTVFRFDGMINDEGAPALPELKEESESDRYSSTSPSVDRVLNSDGSRDGSLGTPSSDQCRRMMNTLGDLMYKLNDKRIEAARPHDIAVMSYSQVQEEKLSVQKALLHFEGIHGRPTTKPEKELMRPLYDRYRSIKRTLAKPPSPREKALELQSVPEDHTLEFNSTRSSSNRDPIHVPTADLEDDGDHDDFMVTRLLKETVRPSPAPSINTSFASVSTVPGDRPRSTSTDPDQEGRGGKNFHEMSKQQLYDEQHRARIDKKRLRRVLKEFEDEFYRQTGRKVQKEDREPMEPEYHEYKQVKARLKLLEALLSKLDPASGL